MQPEIQRFCWFDTAGLKDTARETIWKYKRAIEGHKLILVEWKLMMEFVQVNTDFFFQIYDGHTFSNWGSFPGIFDQSTLDAFTINQVTSRSYSGTLNNWECKELTLSCRNTNASSVGRFMLIVYFYEIPMTKAETFEYAVKQPRYKIRHGGPTTLSRFED